MAAWLAALYLLCHGLALALLPGHATAVSFSFLVGAPLLAALACLWRMRRSSAWVGWLALALGMLLWAGGMALNMYQEIGAGMADAVPGASMLLYVLYGVPLTFAMAHPRHEPWQLIVIDGALALLLGYLFFVHTFSFATLHATGEQGIVSLRLMFDIENLFIAVFALVRFLASEDAARRVFFRALAVFGWVYLGVAAYINHLAADDSYGGVVDLLIDVPFLLLAVLALRSGTGGAVSTPRRLALAVGAGSPLILPAALLVVSALLVRAHPYLAVMGFALATLGSGLRSVVMQVRSLERQDQLDVLARIDSLTGLANRRQFDQALQAEWSRARRNGQGVALLMLDIDHFKTFNDRFGHPLGDACLRAVATALAGCATRGTDVVARYGGEEFAVVVPAASRDGVLALAETMRTAVERLRLPSQDPQRPVSVTVSIGMARVEAVGGSDPAALVAATDAALYLAKRRGRNQVAEGALPL
ncbi:GGDEF domain-containing protein [Stenotrophomonas rhizophila]|uniref:GGDEF domain-containing protein n=1 Tax=Stenotrophomonas rhizophila TaxID=216778 RepID=UPI001E553E6C|nr:GGDEF domain-containing protein [Stenotrophomonas rhizophila]MCC7633795.1 GGDEF domain-containing protein [Stenotrophomonas rhizophila]MCC7663741.1 GGDEF domain-containing protein [Stenotrophomonas rhizophila]